MELSLTGKWIKVNLVLVMKKSSSIYNRQISVSSTPSLYGPISMWSLPHHLYMVPSLCGLFHTISKWSLPHHLYVVSSTPSLYGLKYHFRYYFSLLYNFRWCLISHRIVSCLMQIVQWRSKNTVVIVILIIFVSFTTWLYDTIISLT